MQRFLEMSSIQFLLLEIKSNITSPTFFHGDDESRTFTCRCFLSLSSSMFLQDAVEGLISHYKGMRRLTTTCWFAQTVLSPLWYETVDRRNTAPESARRWRKISTAGNFHFVGLSLRKAYSLVPLTPPAWTQYLHISVHHFFISPLLPVCFYRAFNFQRHNRKCHLLPFDRFTHGVQKQANVNFTLYEKKGKCRNIQNKSLLMHCGASLTRTFIRIYAGRLFVEDSRLCFLHRLLDLVFLCWHSKNNQPPSPPCRLIAPVGRVARTTCSRLK